MGVLEVNQRVQKVRRSVVPAEWGGGGREGVGSIEAWRWKKGNSRRHEKRRIGNQGILEEGIKLTRGERELSYERGGLEKNQLYECQEGLLDDNLEIDNHEHGEREIQTGICKREKGKLGDASWKATHRAAQADRTIKGYRERRRRREGQGDV